MSYVLDSFAILALLNDEPGAERVEALLLEAGSGTIELAMSLIDLGEVAYIVERRWGQAKLRTALAYLDATALQMAEVNKESVLAAAHVKATRSLAYADAFAIALALQRKATLVTGDPEFHSVSDLVTIEWLAEQQGQQ